MIRFLSALALVVGLRAGGDGGQSRMNRIFAVACGLFVFVWSAAIHHQRFQNPTAVSRQDLLHSLSVHGEWFIDRYHENTPDKAFAGSHYYSDKAPATVAAVFPAYRAGVALLRVQGKELESPSAWRFLSWFSCALVFCPLLGYATYRLVQAMAGPHGLARAWLVAGAFALGGMPVVYCLTLYSHGVAWVAMAVALCDLRLLDGRPTAPPPRAFAAGVWLGFALASEYTLGLTVVGFAAWTAWRHGWRSLGWMCAGGVIPCLTIPAYSWIVLGTPWQLPYSFQASFPQMQAGLYGIQLPSVWLTWSLLFGTERGLFYWSPFLLTGLIGLPALAREHRSVCWFALLTFVANVVVISGRDFEWLAGVSFGPRYLTSVLPALILAAPYGVRQIPGGALGLGALSLLLTAGAVLTNPMTYGDPDPISGSFVRAYEAGDFSLNLWTRLGLLPATAFWIHAAVLFAGFGGLLIWGNALDRGPRSVSPAISNRPSPSPVQPSVSTSSAAGFTLIELLFVMAIVSVLAGLVLPAISKVRNKAQQARCTSNLRQLGIGLLAYAHDSGEWLPRMSLTNGTVVERGTLPWDIPRKTVDALGAFGITRGVLACPSEPDRLTDRAWDYREQYRVVGYSFGLGGTPHLRETEWFMRLDQGPRIAEQSTADRRATNVVAEDWVMAADIVVSQTGHQGNPGANDFTGIPGGYPYGGRSNVLHQSAHLNYAGRTPMSAGVLYGDGHVARPQLRELRVRSDQYPYFWW